MKKHAFKYIIDVLLFVDICSVAAIGLLLGFVIPKGREPQAAKYFLGLHRHDWGDIHLYLAVLLLALLCIHLWLSWTWIVQSTKRYFGDNWKNILWAITAAWIAILIIAWIVVLL